MFWSSDYLVSIDSWQDEVSKSTMEKPKSWMVMYPGVVSTMCYWSLMPYKLSLKTTLEVHYLPVVILNFSQDVNMY